MKLLDICGGAEDKNAKQDIWDAAAWLIHPLFRVDSTLVFAVGWALVTTPTATSQR